MTLNEKASYIKGLCDGMELDTASKEGKVIAALLELVSDMAIAIEDLEAETEELRDYIEEIDEDLGDVEELLCDEEDDYDDFECDGDCCNCDEECDIDLEDDEFFEVECPSCGEVICFDGSIDPEELACPACGEKFECIVDADDLKALDEE
ncbi:MAG: hypothetical protein E7653_04255 [Ruminococcaceae bacterium]|nr:hypothetical protein [Oscillospiraceae bacterium]